MTSDRKLFGVGCSAYIFHGEELLLLKRSKVVDYRPDCWDLPGGGLEESECPYDGVKREVQEETGLILKDFVPIDFYTFYKSVDKNNILRPLHESQTGFLH